MPAMNKTLLIIQREYMSKVKKKSFLIMTILGPLIFGGLIVAVALIAASDTTHQHVLLADDLGFLLEDEILLYEQGGVDRPRFRNSERLSYDFRKGTVDATKELESGVYTAVVQLSDISYTDGKVQMFAEKTPSMGIQNRISSDIEDALELYRAKKNNITIETYKSIRQSVDINVIKPSEGGKEDLTSTKAMIGFGFAIIIYFFIFFYGVQVMRGVMEEKTNRIVEVIVSSVRPFQLMMGKIIGIGLVGLTQFLIWVGLTAAISVFGVGAMQQQLLERQKEQLAVVNSGGVIEAQNMSDANDAEAMQTEMLAVFAEISWTDLIVSFLIFFVCGYMLYASLFAAIGASVDNETDSQQFMMPVTLPLIFGYIVSTMMIENPESSIGNIFALVPLTSPIVMMVKTAIGVSIGLKLISIVILVASIFFFVWLAGKIYRVGILMYGKKPSYRELWKWMRY
jgi:ABC-2 type transport system permease protein